MRTSPILKGASGSHRPVRPDAVYALIGAVAISTGVLIYLLDRSPESVYFLPAVWHSHHAAWFGPLGGVLPQFLHVFAFRFLRGFALHFRNSCPHRYLWHIRRGT
jgi:hypothetical protein